MIRLLNELQIVQWAFKHQTLEELLEDLDKYFQHLIKLSAMFEGMVHNHINLVVIEKYNGLGILMNLLVQSHKLPTVSQPLSKEILRILSMSLRNAQIGQQFTQNKTSLKILYNLATRYFQEMTKKKGLRLESIEILQNCFMILRILLAAHKNAILKQMKYLEFMLNKVIKFLAANLPANDEELKHETLKTIHYLLLCKKSYTQKDGENMSQVVQDIIVDFDLENYFSASDLVRNDNIFDQNIPLLVSSFEACDEHV